MKIYTSYFSNWRKWPEGAEPIAVALYTPRGFKGKKYAEVAPTEILLKAWKEKKCGEEVYEEVYRSQLRRLGGERIVRDLERLGGGKDVVLICFEKSGDFCHRHILADFLRESMTMEVEEV